MGIGRRKFLEYLSIAFVGINVDSFRSIAINTDYYVNKKFGILLTKPKGWEFISVKDLSKIKTDQILADEFESSKDEVWKEIGDPVLVIAKYGPHRQEYKDKFSPAITVFINHKNDIIEMYEDEDIKGDFEKIVGMVAYGSSKLFKNYKTIKNIAPHKLSNCKGFDSKWTWTFETLEHQKKFLCKTWSIMVEKGDYIYAFNMIDSEQAGESEEQTFEEFINTIKIS